LPFNILELASFYSAIKFGVVGKVTPFSVAFSFALELMIGGFC